MAKKEFGGKLVMELDIVQASTSEIEKINQLVNHAYRGDSSKVGWTTEANLLHGQRTDELIIREYLEEEDSVILIAYEANLDLDDEAIEDDEDREVVGCVLLQKKENCCYLGMLTVAPTLQGQGIGASLLTESEIYADFWNCQKIEMTVIKQRTELIKWYQKNGYRLTGKTAPFPYGDERFGIPQRDDLEFVILEKKIRQ